LIARAVAWLGRGVRTPVRKALLAGAVDRSVYGRAFGFERTMDTVGAIVGPLTALWLVALFPGKYPVVFALTLLPGLAAAVLIGLVVQEKKRAPVPHASFGERIYMLPRVYRRFLIAVGIFGAGAFAHRLQPGEAIPHEVTHRVTLSQAELQNAASDNMPLELEPALDETATAAFTTAIGGHAQVDGTGAVVLSPPLQGDSWVDSDGAGAIIGAHRYASFSVNGTLFVPQTFT